MNDWNGFIAFWLTRGMSQIDCALRSNIKLLDWQPLVSRWERPQTPDSIEEGLPAMFHWCAWFIVNCVV